MIMDDMETYEIFMNTSLSFQTAHDVSLHQILLSK